MWKEEEFSPFLFCNVACTDRTAGVSKKYVEVASVIADIKYGCVLWNIFFSDHSNLCTGDPKDESEYCWMILRELISFFQEKICR